MAIRKPAKDKRAKGARPKAGKIKPGPRRKRAKRADAAGTKSKAAPGVKPAGRSDGVVASTAKLLDATALAKMVVSQLEGAVRAVAMSMLRNRDGGLQDKYAQLSLDGQLEILAAVLDQAAEMAEATELEGLDASNDIQIARARALLPTIQRLLTELERLSRELA